MTHRDARRLSFGTDAEQYDRARPSYPPQLIDLICAGGAPRVLDVGCGTGIASRLFLARGCEVLGVEADERMAAVARAHGVDVVVSAFEQWDPSTVAPFDVVISAQAWHWVDPDVGPAKAADALPPGGRLALFWNGYDAGDLRETFNAVYRRAAPALVGTAIVLHPPDKDRSQHADSVDASGFFEPVEQRDVPWERTYSRDEWLDQLQTHSDHRVLPPDELQTVLDGIGEVIDANGGALTIRHVTRLLRARRC